MKVGGGVAAKNSEAKVANRRPPVARLLALVNPNITGVLHSRSTAANHRYEISAFHLSRKSLNQISHIFTRSIIFSKRTLA
jgi:hypothetical protein